MKALVILMIVASLLFVWWGRMTVYCAFGYHEARRGVAFMVLGFIGFFGAIAVGCTIQ